MLTQTQQNIIDQAVSIIANLYQTENLTVSSPDIVKQFCQLHLAHLEHEVFGVLFLNSRHQLIKFSQLFRGTINGASVHVREVAKDALSCNAAALVLTHNHPSGNVEPSAADKAITVRLVEAMALFDIRILDYIVVSHTDTLSFAENGLL